MQQYNVMIIDDSELDIFISKNTLKSIGFTDNPISMTSAVEALNYLESNKNDKEKLPRFIFLDLNMPVVDGFMFLFDFEDCSAEVKEYCNIIVLSSLIEEKVIQKVKNNKYVLDFVSKPLKENELLKIEQKILEKL
ncbi:MAG: response regulator [Cytophagales bacterium]|nr:response regulator [Cytophagales bacterium]